MKGPGFLILMGIGVLLWWEPGLVGLRVGAVKIEGCRHLSSAVAESLAASHVGFTMGISTCRSLERAFESLPIVETAEVTMVWPDTLKLQIDEMRLIARTDNRAVAFDEDGNRYEALEGVPESLPELIGWSPGDGSAWVTTFKVLSTIQNAQPAFFNAARVFGPPFNGSLTVCTRADDFSVLLPCPADRGLEDRLAYVPVVLADARSHGEFPTSADLRWENQIVIGFEQEPADR